MVGANNFNRNIASNMMSFNTAGFDGREFFKMMENYPNLDLNLVDSSGRNIVFSALMNPAPIIVINYLLEKKTPLNQVDKDGYNLLHMFCFYGKSKDSINIFNKVFESIEDISLKNKYNESFLDSFINGSIDKSIHEDHKKRYKSWLDISLIKLNNHA